MLNLFRLEYKGILVGYRFSFKDYCYDISLKSISYEDGESYIISTYPRISGGKSIPTLNMIATSDGLLKTKEELDGKLNIPIVSIEDVESESDFYNREHLFTLYQGVLDSIIKKEKELNKEVSITDKDVIKILKDIIATNNKGFNFVKRYGDDCIDNGGYTYSIETDISNNKLNKIIFDTYYDISNYSNASFIKELRDYDGWYKQIDTSHPTYKPTLASYDSLRLAIKSSNLYEVKEDSFLTLEDKDTLTYNHIISISFKEPMAITKDNIANLVLQFT